MEEILKEIESLNEYSQQKKWQELREKVSLMNRLDKDNEPVFRAAKEKGLI